ncbi:MAG: PilZ domain-containing protein [Deltaproteobacteria bacterium]|nr:PilZ domain-containing protein [Deltaproteobacteria bacterium]
MTPTSRQKKVAVFEPVEHSRTLLGEVLENLSYKVELHKSATKISGRARGDKIVDLLIINLSLLGETYQEVTKQLEQLNLAGDEVPPIICLTTLRVSQDARNRLEQLGADIVFLQSAPFMELMFAINRLLFPKIRELRQYTRVYCGFPMQFFYQNEWQEGAVYNLSHQGAFIQCESPPPENTRLQVRFILPGTNNTLQVEAHVNWANDPGAIQDQLSPHGMGVRFLVMNQEESTSIDLFISERAS